MEYNYGHNDSNKVYVNGKPVPMTAEQQQAFSDQTFINDVMIRAFMYMFIAVLLTAVRSLPLSLRATGKRHGTAKSVPRYVCSDTVS